MEIQFKGNKNNVERDKKAGIAYIISALILPIFTLILGIPVIFKGGGFTIAIGIILGVLLFISGVIILIRTSKYKKISKILSKTPNTEISLLMKTLKKPLEPFSGLLWAMCKRGYLGDAVLNLYDKELITDKEAPLPAENSDDRETIYKTYRKTPAIQLILAFTAALSIFLPMSQYEYRLALPIGIIFGIGVFAITLYYIPLSVVFREAPRPMPKVKAYEKTGNHELDDLLKGVLSNQKELIRLNHGINNLKINKPLESSIKTLEAMTTYLIANPDKIKSLRQFTGYYLPTTVRLLQSYEELSTNENKGENINTAMRKIESMMSKVSEIFKHEYDDMFMDKAMDISAEVDVMKVMIEQTAALNPFESSS